MCECVYRLAHRMFTQQVHIHNNALNFLRLPFKSFSTFLCFYFSIRVGIGPVGREKDKISSRSGSVATTTTSFQRFPRAIKFLLSSSMLFIYPNGFRVSIVSVVFAVTGRWMPKLLGLLNSPSVSLRQLCL